MPTFVNFTVTNGTNTQNIFTVTDEVSGTVILNAVAIAPNDPPIPLRANPDPNTGNGMIAYGVRNGVPTVHYTVRDGDQVAMS